MKNVLLTSVTILGLISSNCFAGQVVSKPASPPTTTTTSSSGSAAGNFPTLPPGTKVNIPNIPGPSLSPPPKTCLGCSQPVNQPKVKIQ